MKLSGSPRLPFKGALAHDQVSLYNLLGTMKESCTQLQCENVSFEQP